ncbi:ATP-dependent helicase Fun30p [[Candida] jaroonii]|uniref:ATP-dependent helicase Fun30p n=1 Tax=[Candida] jaroonii TaxID=467808 RepID=A0ACA9Y747_9ASCO|nr:ATP-dependent helicase Fun30p [[Candida] jaroonii]
MTLESPKQSEIQVPGSSPIYSKSPTKKFEEMPSIMDEKERLLEIKRQAIRNHKNFPLIREKFYYVSESDIFKGFVKGKGDLREVTNWLNTNVGDLSSHKMKQQQQLQDKLKQQKEDEMKRKRENFLKELEVDSDSEEDGSPVKIRNKVKTIEESPIKPSNFYNKESISTKVEVTKPKISILDKYGYKKETVKPKKKLVRLSSLSSPMTTTPEPEAPEADLEILESKINSKKSVVLDSDDEFSDIDEYEEINGLTSMDAQILTFLNTASLQEIVEISNFKPETIEKLIEMRPFDSIDAISEEHFENYTKRPRKMNGLKIIENSESSLKGYRAVDSLVKKCSEIGLVISKQMEKWGVHVNGHELEMVEIENPQDIEIDEEDITTKKKSNIHYLTSAPVNFSENFELKNYQVVGLNWLNLLYSNNLSCILADEMGLGKTCQVIAFMAYLKSVGKSKGPHLVIVPSSTLENWLREFSKFCPDLVVQAYYGSQSEREELRYELRSVKYDVMVTTYNLASGSSQDFKFLVKNNFDMIIYDEGHMLKNSNSDRYNKLMRLDGKFRLLLTGTPLQNNLKELISLLAFMLPKYFVNKKEDLQVIFNQKVKTTDVDSNYNPLLQQQAISKAKTMMSPFILRRKKDQVLKHLPPKIHKIEYLHLLPAQEKIYDHYLNQGKQSKQTGKKMQASNIIMYLRKAAIHPLLFRDIFHDDKLKEMSHKIVNEPEYVEANKQYIFEDMQVMSDYELNNLCIKFPKTLSSYIFDDEKYLDSSKVTKLVEIINDIIAKKEKILVFSLFTQVLDILEKVMSIKGFKFVRLDGQTTVENRQDIIDTFYEDNTIPVFLLSTKAGGFGINLIAANNVVIFDQSFNPHDDKQAEDRAHRVGQEKDVNVIKLIVKGTIEETMLMVAQNKLALDQSISESDLEAKAGDLVQKLLFEDQS